MPSGLGDFFRSPRAEEAVAGSALQVPSESPTRKRASRIPFLGRTRKKSAISDGTPVTESVLEDSRGDERQESTSFAAKLAANFTPSRSRPPSARRSSRSLASSSLSPPLPTRSPSVDSSSSRATTPRPTITVSHDLSEYEDLFTRPKRKSTVSIATEGSNSSQINFPVLTEPETGTSASQWSSSLSKAHLDTIVRPFELLVDDSDRTLTNSTSLSPMEKRRSFPAIPFRPEKRGAAAVSPFKRSNPTKPPTEPLPNPPTTSRESISALPPRPRAQTLSSVTQLPPINRNADPSMAETKPPDIITQIDLPEEKRLDIDTASVEQLRLALKAKISAFDELSDRLAKVTQAHEAEKSFLEKRVVALEKDALRKDKEIKGLTWLLLNNRPASNAGVANVTLGNLSEAASKSMTSLLESKDGKSSVKLPPQYRRLGAEDSGAESSQMSGAESPYSGTESSSSFPAKRVKRHKLLGARSNLSRSISMKPFRANEGSGTNNTIPDLPSLPKSAKRSSISSLASSTSTSSSLLSPSPTPTVMTHLSAIPEAPTTPPPKSPPSPSLPSLRSSRDPAIVAAIHAAERLREKEERHSNRSSKVAIPSQTPAAAYAANLKRGLAPSIEQVLHQSGAAETMSEKVQPDTKTLSHPEQDVSPSHS